LEKSGLEKIRGMSTTSLHNEDGNRVFSDVVINLPDGKNDCRLKVSLTAYEIH
jgi:DNA recombination protein RmuC